MIHVHQDPGPPVAAVQDLVVSFRRGGDVVQALRGVSLEIRPGEILGLVGESGSGKSVLGLSLLGLLDEAALHRVEGEARVHDVDMVTAPAAERRAVLRQHVGTVFQDPMTSLDPTMRIGHQIREVTDSDEEVLDLLRAVDLPDPERRVRAYPHELSGGQLQRVMIAMAVAGNPSLIVADEPTTALDVTVQKQILELLASLRDRVGCSVLLVTHDLGVAAEIADRISVLYSGRLAELGATAEVLDDPAHPYTVGLLESRLDLAADRRRPLVALRGEPPDPRNPPPGCPFAPRCPVAAPECEAAPPPLVPVGDTGRRAACIRLEEARAFVADADPPPPWSPLPTGDEMVLDLQEVTKSFRLRARRRHQDTYLHALKGIDLHVRRGEAVALVGESGCGKSTLLRIAAGLLPADGGTVQLADGIEPQMVFQDALASLTPWLTVGELVGERLRGRGLGRAEVRAQVAAALQRVGLSEMAADAKPRQLSGGQAQRVALARAIVVPPGLLLADEPTSALDVSLGAVVLNLIGRLRRELGLTVVFVTHDLAAARLIADRIAVMYLGEIVESGPADQVTAAPEHPYARTLLASLPGQHQAAPTDRVEAVS